MRGIDLLRARSRAVHKAVGVAWGLAVGDRGRVAAHWALGGRRPRLLTDGLGYLRELAGVAGCRLAWWGLMGAIGEPGAGG